MARSKVFSTEGAEGRGGAGGGRANADLIRRNHTQKFVRFFFHFHLHFEFVSYIFFLLLRFHFHLHF